MQDDEYKYRAYFPGWLLRYFPAGKTNQIERAELSASLPPRTMWKSWICSMVWSDLGCNLVRSPGPDIKTELSGRPGLRIHRSWSTQTHWIRITDCITCTPCIPINNCINCILMITQHVFVSFYRNVSGHIKAEQTKFNRIRWNFMRQFPEVDAWARRCPVSTAMTRCRGWRGGVCGTWWGGSLIASSTFYQWSLSQHCVSTLSTRPHSLVELETNLREVVKITVKAHCKQRTRPFS